MDASDVKTVAVSAAVIVVGVLLWKASRAAGSVASAAGDAASAAAAAVGEVFTHQLNPASEDNLINRAVTTAGSAISGDAAWTLGGWFYDVTHADPFAGYTAPLPQASYDEGDRLLKRYPAPPRPVEYYDPLGTYLGTW